MINLINVIYGKGFSQNPHLQIHIRTHTGDKPYKCHICGKGFSENGNLQIHIKTHTGDTPYKYDICGKGFSQNPHCIHIRTHTGDKPYKCHIYVVKDLVKMVTYRHTLEYILVQAVKCPIFPIFSFFFSLPIFSCIRAKIPVFSYIPVQKRKKEKNG